MINRVFQKETAISGKAKMAVMYVTHIDESYSRRVNYWQNRNIFVVL